MALTASAVPKSILSNEVMSRFFPWSYSSKFSLVSPRTGLPLESTTVTGTSMMLTLTVSRTCASDTTPATSTSSAAMVIRVFMPLSLDDAGLKPGLPDDQRKRRLPVIHSTSVHHDAQRGGAGIEPRAVALEQQLGQTVRLPLGHDAGRLGGGGAVRAHERSVDLHLVHGRAGDKQREAPRLPFPQPRRGARHQPLGTDLERIAGRIERGAAHHHPRARLRLDEERRGGQLASL